MDAAGLLAFALASLGAFGTAAHVAGRWRWRRGAMNARWLLLAACFLLFPAVATRMIQARIADGLPDAEAVGEAIQKAVWPTTPTTSTTTTTTIPK